VAQNDSLTYNMSLEIYLQGAVVRGVLVTNQDRLSNYLILREGEQVLSLKDAKLQRVNGKPVAVGSDEYLVYMQEIYLIADLSPQLRSDWSGYQSLYVKKDINKALLSVGPYWLQGNLHIVPGGALHDLLVGKTPFIPVTDARLLDCPDLGTRTFLINRAKIGFITALGEGLVEL
jgi:hypothetical protein